MRIEIFFNNQAVPQYGGARSLADDIFSKLDQKPGYQSLETLTTDWYWALDTLGKPLDVAKLEDALSKTLDGSALAVVGKVADSTGYQYFIAKAPPPENAAPA